MKEPPRGYIRGRGISLNDDNLNKMKFSFVSYRMVYILGNAVKTTTTCTLQF